jgi:hypothetical protein
MVEIRYHDLHLSSGGVAVEIKNGEFRYTSETVPGASTFDEFVVRQKFKGRRMIFE